MNKLEDRGCEVLGRVMPRTGEIDPKTRFNATIALGAAVIITGLALNALGVWYLVKLADKWD